MARPQRHYTLDDYFTVEERSEVRHEYFRGEIFAMAGASVEHNDIAANLIALLRPALRPMGCRAFGSDLRIAAPNGLHTYPDVSVICGSVELVAGRPDTATNPVVLFEVLSDATRDYDRGDKFALYKAISALREYVLVEPARPWVEHWRLRRDGSWTVRTLSRLNARLRLRTVKVSVPLSEIYRDVLT